jgi:hypothetical protein
MDELIKFIDGLDKKISKNELLGMVYDVSKLV